MGCLVCLVPRDDAGRPSQSSGAVCGMPDSHEPSILSPTHRTPHPPKPLQAPKLYDPLASAGSQAVPASRMLPATSGISRRSSVIAQQALGNTFGQFWDPGCCCSGASYWNSTPVSRFKLRVEAGSDLDRCAEEFGLCAFFPGGVEHWKSWAANAGL